jgi:hypothetical protein
LSRYGQIWFWYRCTFPHWDHWNIRYTRKGQVKRTVVQIAKVLAFTSAVVGIYKARQRGVNILELVKTMYRMANMMTLKLLALYGIDKAKVLLKGLRERLVASL